MNTKLAFRDWTDKYKNMINLSRIEHTNLARLSRSKLRQVIKTLGDIYGVSYGAYTIMRVGKLLIKAEKFYRNERKEDLV